jgi:hypothetical protein
MITEILSILLLLHNVLGQGTSNVTDPPAVTNATDPTVPTTVKTTVTEAPATTAEPSPSPKTSNVSDVFLQMFNQQWGCKNNDSNDLKREDMEQFIFNETFKYIIELHPNHYNVCYVHPLNNSTLSVKEPTPLYHYNDSGPGCEDNTTKQYHIVTSIKDNKKDDFLACLLHVEKELNYDKFASIGLCVEKGTKEKPYFGFVVCYDDVTAPPHPIPSPSQAASGFATGTFFGGIILGVIVILLIFVGVKYKCGRQGGFTQF